MRACLSRLPGKRARPVLRGPRRSNAPGLPDEIYFSIIQRKVLPQRLPRPRHRRRPPPPLPGLLAGHRHTLRLEVTRTHLNTLLDRISDHEPLATAA
jgi:hypothetical protein